MNTIQRITAVFVAVLISVSASAFDDGLTRSTPEEQGASSRAVAELFQDLEEGGFEVHGLMILRHDKVIAEHWWAPYGPEYTHAMYSSTKTFTAAAIGFAVQEGLVSIEDRVMDFFPELLPEKIPAGLPDLKVKHLLSMSAGHATTSYPGNGSDQVRSFLATEFAHEPGTSFAYDITCSHMLSRIITKVTGISLFEYLKPRLLDSIGISGDIVWEMDYDGCNMGNGGMHSRTSDLAKFGLFLKNRGRWNGQQLLDPKWIDEMTTPHIYQHPERTAEENSKDDGSQGYGYQTWMGRNGSYRAIGASNQVILVMPQYDLVVASNGSIRDENGFNDIIYKFASTLSDRKLKPEKGFSLSDALSGYALATPFEKGDGASAVKSCTRRYRMHVNELDITNISFRFDAAGNCFMTIESAGSVNNIPFGLDCWLYGQTDRRILGGRSVYPNPMGTTPYVTAGYCSWAEKDRLDAYSLSMFNVGSADTFHISFDADNITVNAGRTVLTGTLIKTTL